MKAAPDSFWVVPAIDLLDGRVVRLRAGDFGRASVYGESPAAWARKMAEQGARRLHVVDLSGARAGSPVHLMQLAQIVRETGLPVQFGGGLRSLDSIRRAMDAGASVAILGTAALSGPLLRSALDEFGPDRIWAAVDLKEGRVAVGGWLEQAPLGAAELARRVIDAGVRFAVVTDTSRDGLFAGPNLDAAREVASYGLTVFVAGGIGRAADVAAVARAARTMQGPEAAPAGPCAWEAPRGRIAGVVIGRALYEGRLSLPEALEAARCGLEGDGSRCPPAG